MYAWLVRNVERLVEELEYHVVRAGRLSVYLWYKDGEEGFGDKGFASPTDRFDLLTGAARACFLRAWSPGRAAVRMHVNALDLRRPGSFQPGLFDPPEGRRGPSPT